MMSQQQQQILMRSAMAAGVTLAVGLSTLGFVSARGAASDPAPVAAMSDQALPAAGGAQAEFVLVAGAPADAAVATSDVARSEPIELVRGLDDDDDWGAYEDEYSYEDDDEAREHREHHDEDDDEDDDEHEGVWESLKRALERRDHD